MAVHGVCAPYEKEFLARDGGRVPILIAGARVDDAPEGGAVFCVIFPAREGSAAALPQQVASGS